MTKSTVDDLPECRLVPIDENRARILGDRLRQAFDEVIAEPLPAAFADLLRLLD